MASEDVDDTDARFDYKDDAWSTGGQAGEYDGTSHSTDTASAQVVFGPFTGARMQTCVPLSASLKQVPP